MKHWNFEAKKSRCERMVEIELLDTPRCCVNVVRAKHITAQYNKRIPWPMRRFYLSRVRTDCLLYVRKIVLTMLEHPIEIKL